MCNSFADNVLKVFNIFKMQLHESRNVPVSRKIHRSNEVKENEVKFMTKTSLRISKSRWQKWWSLIQAYLYIYMYTYWILSNSPLNCVYYKPMSHMAPSANKEMDLKDERHSIEWAWCSPASDQNAKISFLKQILVGNSNVFLTVTKSPNQGL